MPDVTPTTETPPDQPTPGSPVRYEEINTVTSGPGEHFARYDALRAAAPAHPGIAPAGNPFLLVSSASGIRGCLQDTATFSSSSVTPEEPNPPYKWIPEMIDPPLHTNGGAYHLDAAIPVREHGGQVGLDNLPLIWNATDATR